jgi:tRNA A64-2'-O-ribosylphosphate transferase
MSTPTLSELIFSNTANHNFSHILADLRRSNLSISNRLRSINQDAAFVKDVAAAFRRPLVANERCGSWYIDPELKVASAYFKSTDGHAGQWKFSTRRLNLHLLELVGTHDGCIIVDSTRRGKRMPDALSKTIPIWCAVLNASLFPGQTHELYTPPNVVPSSEHSQMATRIPDFVTSLHSLHLDLEELRNHITKPLRPIWLTPETDLSLMEGAAFEGFHPLICCTSSRRVSGAEMSEGGYIQGAGDDTENWALGLTAQLFWEHKDELLSTPEVDLPGKVIAFVEASTPLPSGEASRREIAPGIFVGPLPLADDLLSEYHCAIILSQRITERETWIRTPSRMEVGLGKHKIATRYLRTALPDICSFVSRCLSAQLDETGHLGNVLIACESGRDLSVATALAVYCWCYDDQGKSRLLDEKMDFTKSAIRVKLGRIMTAFPEANPSRAALQSVNSFLMDWQK